MHDTSISKVLIFLMFVRIVRFVIFATIFLPHRNNGNQTTVADPAVSGMLKTYPGLVRRVGRKHENCHAIQSGRSLLAMRYAH
jgi:hypothetical protein